MGDGTPVIKEAAADKGYQNNEQLELASSLGVRTYIPEPERQHPAKWADKPPEQRAAVEGNRRRMQRAKGKRLQRLRSERVERSFAQVCETGGARRTWLRGREKVQKRSLLSAAAHNLGLILRSLFKLGTPRGLQGLRALLYLAWLIVSDWWNALGRAGRASSC